MSLEEVHECMFVEFVLRKPPIMQTSESLKVVAQSVTERRASTPRVSSTRCIAIAVEQGLRNRPHAGAVVGTSRAARFPSPKFKRARRTPSASVFNEDALGDSKPSLIEAVDSERTMAPRPRWETNRTGVVR